MSGSFVSKNADQFPEIRPLYPILDLFGPKCHIAGGVFRNLFMDTNVKDVDIFFEDKDSFDGAIRTAEGLGFKKLSGSTNIADYRHTPSGHRIQLIGENADEDYSYGYGPPQFRLEAFDFTITKFVLYFDGVNYMVKHHANYFSDLDNARIVGDSEFINPIMTMSRVIRYTDYGYTIPPKELADLIIQLQKSSQPPERVYRALKVSEAPPKPRLF